MKSYEIQNDIEKLARARRQKIDGMLLRDIAEYIAEQLEEQRTEIQEATEEDSDKAAEAIEQAASEFVYNNADGASEYYRQDLRRFIEKLADALGYTPSCYTAERLQNMALLTY